MPKTFNPTNSYKLTRAQHIADLLLGKVEAKNDEDETLKVRHAELLEEKGINLKDEEAVLESVYLALGGGIGSVNDEEAPVPKKSKAKTK